MGADDVILHPEKVFADPTLLKLKLYLKKSYYIVNDLIIVKYEQLCVE